MLAVLDDAGVDAMCTQNERTSTGRRHRLRRPLDGVDGQLRLDLDGPSWTDPADDAANIAWTRAGWATMSPWAARDRIYLNFTGHGEDPSLTEHVRGDVPERRALGSRPVNPAHRSLAVSRRSIAPNPGAAGAA